MYTLDQLQCFITVAEHLHFGHAADELNMTQPPLSRQIQKLEKDVGTPLLFRNNRKVELTPAGETFLHQARNILNSADNARELARLSAAGLSGRIRIGYTTAAGLSILGPLLRFIKDKIPEVQIEVFEMVTREQLDALHEGTLDLAIGRIEHADEDYRITEIQSESLVLAAPEDHPLMQLEAPLLREHIGGYPLIIYSSQKARYFYDITVRNFRVDHHQVAYSLSQVGAMIALVASDFGIALVPESAERITFPGVKLRKFADLKEGIIKTQMIANAASDNPIVDRLFKLVQESRGQVK
ncbi:LysR family transcriptional regulator [Corynebacterium ammoniagenes]|uniref:Transcriptional regulator n=1 Tax=Corynebacterium ammoniagenes TaxID=1697 RepID=A0AAV5GA10_CORAM|nr:LysR family transcriptional regulator [Corynebacterium ammoniagenes]GJN43627.1 transcriptional regulator [Corynebacterium ammoniagenes]